MSTNPAMSKNITILVLFDFYSQYLTDKQREVIEQYYGEDLSLAEISENIGITRQGVRDNIKRAEAALIALEKRFGDVARSEQRNNAMQRIGKSVETISELARGSGQHLILEEIGRIRAALEEL